MPEKIAPSMSLVTMAVFIRIARSKKQVYPARPRVRFQAPVRLSVGNFYDFCVCFSQYIKIDSG
ncbi:MAG: hypothetical protein GF398_03920 [Chitinivibrionales bacterium]|nr:hypothetical protein [Chitinivibrionales bacterium]